MKIIETANDYNEFLDKFSKFPSIMVPVFSNSYDHPIKNPLVALCIRMLGTVEDFILPFRHNDCVNLTQFDLDRLKTSKRIYTPFKKSLMHVWNGSEGIVDIAGYLWANGQDIPKEQEFYSPALKHFLNKFHYVPNIFQCASIILLMQFLKVYLDSLMVGKYGSETSFHNSVIIPATFELEKSGIHVDRELFKQTFSVDPVDEFVYTEYNPYTTTNRITSRFGGINFSALNKTDGTRRCFTSRFTDGKMILIDFESFHLRLLAYELKIYMGKDPIHESLGKYYFNTNYLTPEQYEESKKLTFSLIYGDEERDEYKNNGFIDAVYAYRRNLSKKSVMLRAGHELNIKNGDSIGKMLNYILQELETTIMMTGIYGILPIMKKYQSKMILCSFDSLLLDVLHDEQTNLLNEIIPVLEQNGKFPVRVKEGLNFHDMHPIKKDNSTTFV